MDTKVAIALAVEFISQHEHKPREVVVMMLLVEALTARGIMHPLTKEKNDAKDA